jgi:hypothetical protein
MGQASVGCGPIVLVGCGGPDSPKEKLTLCFLLTFRMLCSVLRSRVGHLQLPSSLHVHPAIASSVPARRRHLSMPGHLLHRGQVDAGSLRGRSDRKSWEQSRRSNEGKGSNDELPFEGAPGPTEA